MQQILNKIISESKDRYDFWIKFLKSFNLHILAEIGIYKGVFAQNLLLNSSSIEKYYMIDPWRNLKDWNKPSNTSDSIFENFYEEALLKTDFAKKKRHVLRGKTLEVIDQIPDSTLDFIYIDGDHTLKGITIDLINSWSKIKENGFIAGDDFCSNVWQHEMNYEPTFVSPFAIYFAEAMDVKIFALPFNQFLIAKELKGFEFKNLTSDDYQNINLLGQLKKYPDEKRISQGNFFSKLF